MDKKGILTVRMMGTISVEYEGEFFPIGTALTGKILQLFLILLYAGKKGVGREELLDAFYGNGEYANPSGSLRAAVFQAAQIIKKKCCQSMSISVQMAVFTGGMREM